MFVQTTAKRVQLPVKQVEQVIALLEEGNTVPFIARYRKEATGSLDEVQIKAIEDGYQYVKNVEQRKEEVLRIIEEQGKLTPELQQAIIQATVLQKVEDLYRPYMQKRRTRATIAKEKGLEPLAEQLLRFPKESLSALAMPYVQTAEGLDSLEDVLAGVSDIIAELLADEASIRELVRKTAWDASIIQASKRKAAEDERQVFEMYYDYSEPIKKVVPHRVLAMNRGEKEKIIKVSIQFPEERLAGLIYRDVIKQTGTELANWYERVVQDALKRLILPSIEREFRAKLTDQAEEQAIHVFSENLKSLLLQPPMQGHVVLGVDPAFRTGCKLAIVDETGKLLEVLVIYPTPPRSQVEQSEKVIVRLLEKYPISIIAIGNGTASRETESFIAQTLKKSDKKASYVIVNEAGASVYSASTQAREEFPDLQVEERSAVSIARRLQDPLSELVKIDPGSVGVGQYQHDVAKKRLDESLTFVVETAVNRVGVNVNTASSSLLQYVAGLSKTVAENIVHQRNEEGLYTARTQLKKVPRLGAKTYEQAVGFLRVPESKNPFDRTGLHPESYQVAEQLLQELGFKKEAIGTEEVRMALEAANKQELGATLSLGLVTLTDIIETLKRPNRDPREDFPQPLLKAEILEIADLQEGMELQGTVRNVVDFGAFVDIGVSEDGLVHISKLKKGFVKHPLDVVASGDIVTVWIDSVDKQKGRIALTMIPPKNDK